MTKENSNLHTLAAELTAIIEVVVGGTLSLTNTQKAIIIDAAIKSHEDNPIPASSIFINTLAKLKNV
jgi:hypothetical protein